MSSTTETTISNMAAETAKRFTFDTMDYIVFVIMLLTSASIGIYFGFFSKAKNTTDEYLTGGKKMKTIPIAISLVASQLSGIAIMSVPAETYTFGFLYTIFMLSLIVVVPILCYIITPVFYENNLSNCYEYLQLRFNKRTRQIVTATFIFNGLLMLPVFMFVPSLAFSQVTGVNVHLINSIVCFICVFYTMLGGIKAVVWTDVVQGGVMLGSIIIVSIMGIGKTGGFLKVLELAQQGGRLDMNFSWDLRVRTTAWNALIGGIFVWTGHIGLNQSCVQRIVSLPTLKHAQRSLKLAGIGFLLITLPTAFIGIIMFALYYGCDPILAGLVQKPDNMMPFFVQDIMGHLRGMPGVFISCVFSAALSTLSANLNSLAGIIYFDYIKPFIQHSEARANFIMKMVVLAMGGYCVLAGFVVENFTSILQMIITIIGINTGAVAGVFLIGMFVPRVNGKVAFTAVAISFVSMLWIIANAQMRFNAGFVKYIPLPTTLDECEAGNFTFAIKSITTTTTSALTTFNDTTTTMPPLLTTAFESNRPFSIYEISFYWYNVMGTLLVWLSAIPLSYIWTYEKGEKFNQKLFAPVVRKFLNIQNIELELEVPLKLSAEKADITEKGNYINT